MLGEDRERVHLVSISIDPEEDTPARLHDYARRFEAGPSWQHYTGTVSASLVVQRAFQAYRGDKMGHPPVTFVRTAPGESWVRLDGFATADTLLREVRGHGELTASAAAQGEGASKARRAR
jgi:protein SCO1/2